MLTPEQQGYAQQAIDMDLPGKVCAMFYRNYPCLRDVLTPEELEAEAMFSCASAAKTYNPDIAGISAYFTKAIVNDILSACSREIRTGSRSAYRISYAALEKRQQSRPAPLADPALLALESMAASDRQWIERHVLEGASIRCLGREFGKTPYKAGNILRVRLDRLQRAIEDQPHWHPAVDTAGGLASPPLEEEDGT